eukprot:GHRR01034109.1.p1 GENE.GHRR01034109.1~~GHRR01034109.1.p1  ORF type:complete len:153 (+),score=30.99 GHRR01034109.1:85-543(+)
MLHRWPVSAQCTYSRQFRTASSRHTIFCNMAHGSRGAFILFEGIDRCGKSTQTKKLTAALQEKGVSATAALYVSALHSRSTYMPYLLQVSVQSWNFPDRHNTATGHAINEYLTGCKEQDDRAIHLLFSANRWEKRQARSCSCSAISQAAVQA